MYLMKLGATSLTTMNKIVVVSIFTISALGFIYMHILDTKKTKIAQKKRKDRRHK